MIQSDCLWLGQGIVTFHYKSSVPFDFTSNSCYTLIKKSILRNFVWIDLPSPLVMDFLRRGFKMSH